METGSEGEKEKRGEEGRNPLEVFTRFVDENKRWITYGLYGLSVMGGVIAVRSLGVFQRFKTIHDIPPEFVQRNNNLFGMIERTELAAAPGGVFGPRLLISHIPIYGRPDRQSEYFAKNSRKKVFGSENDRPIEC